MSLLGGDAFEQTIGPVEKVQGEWHTCEVLSEPRMVGRQRGELAELTR